MQYEQIKPYIKEENENEYILDLWQINNTFNYSFRDREAAYNNFEQFLSKVMEIERVFIEKNDGRPTIALKKTLKECVFNLQKQNGELYSYTLYPYGYWDSWEIFKVDKIDN